MRRYAALTPIAVLLLTAAATAADDADRIRPYERNPYYWQYKGEPVLLLGGSWQDNLFNHPIGLERHLDLLTSVGGNYLRNVMSHRNEGNVFPYERNEDGLFDLDRFNEAYWRRLERFLELTCERDIIVQIEIWATWDYYRDHQTIGGWDGHPFNPANNVNYTPEESGLPVAVEYTPAPWPTEHPFFRSVPALDNNQLVLKHQQAFVDKLLSIALPFPNVLYCMNNEVGERVEWGDYWADYVRAKAAEAGKRVETADMRREKDIAAPDHRHLVAHPDRYTFIDISQNNANRGQIHGDRIRQMRALIADRPRPLNNTKVYTFDPDNNIALARWWRAILEGCASARFHRPHPLEGVDDHEKWSDVGLGLSPLAQAHIRSARTLMDALGWPDVAPDPLLAAAGSDAALQIRTDRTHIAYTRDAQGRARLYLDGRETTAMDIGGDLSNWDAGYRLALADELSRDRGWRGAYHYAALYNRALSPSEIAAHDAAGAPQPADGLLARYAFDEGEGTVVRDVSGLEPPLDLLIAEPDAAAWREDGLHVNGAALIATQEPAARLTEAVRETNAFTLEAWVTPAELVQSGPARVITLSSDISSRNFTLGHSGTAWQTRFRTTETNENGLPAIGPDPGDDASIAAMRSVAGDRAAIFVTHGRPLTINADRLAPGLSASWFDPGTAETQEAVPAQNGAYVPPSADHWILLLR